MAGGEPYTPDPNDFYALVDAIEVGARDARHMNDTDRETIITTLGEIRAKSEDADEENLIYWYDTLQDYLNNMVSPGSQPETIGELLEAAPENVERLQTCTNDIRLEMEGG
jgi:hypothetical protein